MSNRVTPLTDDRGQWLLPFDQRNEPRVGSVVLSDGLHGTAWQRRFSDGLWTSAMTGQAKTWEVLIQSRRSLVLVYEAEPRPKPAGLPRTAGGVWVQ